MTSSPSPYSAQVTEAPQLPLSTTAQPELYAARAVVTEKSDRELTELLEENGVKIRALSAFFQTPREDLHCFVVSYAGLREETVEQVLEILERIAKSDN